jgi:hypothetical protein
MSASDVEEFLKAFTGLYWGRQEIHREILRGAVFGNRKPDDGEGNERITLTWIVRK